MCDHITNKNFTDPRTECNADPGSVNTGRSRVFAPLRAGITNSLSQGEMEVFKTKGSNAIPIAIGKTTIITIDFLRLLAFMQLYERNALLSLIH
jgi:hypothetical protein